MGAPVRFQKAVSRSKENAAVERRQANALRHWAYAARRQDVTPRLSALRSLTFREGRCPLAASEGKTTTAHPAPRPPGAAELCILRAGCLTRESDIRAQENFRRVLAERTRGTSRRDRRRASITRP